MSIPWVSLTMLCAELSMTGSGSSTLRPQPPDDFGLCSLFDHRRRLLPARGILWDVDARWDDDLPLPHGTCGGVRAVLDGGLGVRRGVGTDITGRIDERQ
jgi:hypothetical protein